MSKIKKRIAGKYENTGSEEIKKEGDLSIVLYDFNGINSDELSFHKDDFLIVTNWNIKNGWASGL